jgi:transcriptional regulator with XRE-family HTH domain
LKSIGLLEVERRRQGLSATELAKRMGVGRSSVSQVERGLRPPSGAFRGKAAKALGRRVDDLFPMWFIVCDPHNGAFEVLVEDGRLLAWTSEEEASRYAQQRELQIRGPLGPDFLACLLAVSEDQVRENLGVVDKEDGP